MQIAQKLARYTLGGADLLRRAMGKKKPEEMAKQRDVFLRGAEAGGASRDDAERIFGLLEFFAGYGFNRSHSAAYALLTYQTAYLKAHYPVELLCALLTADRDKTDKVVRLIAEGRAWGVEILPPEINESNIDFTVVYERPAAERATASAADGAAERVDRPAVTDGARRRVRDPLDPKIRFGLGAIRGVGQSTLEALLEARAEDTPFSGLFDLAARVDARRLNRGVLEALVQSGALDASLAEQGVSRAQAFASVERAVERARSASRDRERGQTTLFGAFQQAGTTVESDEFVEAEPWDLIDTLRREKQSLGFHVSGHPLDRYGDALARFEVEPVAKLSGLEPWTPVRVAGTVEGFRERRFRTGGKVAWFELEDLSGTISVKVRDKRLETATPLLTSGEPVLVTGKLSFPMVEDAGDLESGSREPTVFLDDVALLSEAIQARTRRVVIRLGAAAAGREELGRLREVLRGHRGVCPVELRIQTEDGAEAVLALGAELRVAPSDALLAALERLFGGHVAELR